MKQVHNILMFGVIACSIAVAPSAHAAINVSGDIIAEAKRLEGFSVSPYGSGSNNYLAPSEQEWSQFRTAATALFAGDLLAAETNATSLDYQLIAFTHTNDQRVFFGLRSRETNGVPTKPWGTYFVNTNSALNVHVGAPHPQNDFRSPQLAAESFLKSGARGLLIAGAHRDANGNNTADPGNLTNTIFHAVHEAWSGTNAENTQWQIHGYGPANHPDFPSNCLAVLSTGADGANTMSTNIVILDQHLEWNGIKSYAYNDALATNDPSNIAVNEGVAGTNFDGLAATHNVQGKYSRTLGGTFVHIESATVVRTNIAMRTRAADAIANAILSIRTNVAPLLGSLVLTSAPASNQFRFTTPTERHHAYQAENRTSLSTGKWSVLYSFPGDNQPRAFTNDTMPNASGFFRVRAL
jgi:hypothetical protein